MNISFGESLRRKRMEKNISQRQLSEMLHVDQSTISKWESGSRLPDADMISLLSECLNTDIVQLLRASEKSAETLNVIMLDDEKIVLDGGFRVLAEVLPDAEIHAFTKPADAIRFSKTNRVQLAFLDIEMGRISGLDVCRELLEIEPRTNVIYLTAYREYAFDAWSTGACGYLLKPLTVDRVQGAFAHLRYPVRGLGGKVERI